MVNSKSYLTNRNFRHLSRKTKQQISYEKIIGGHFNGHCFNFVLFIVLSFKKIFRKFQLTLNKNGTGQDPENPFIEDIF
jgi:hypothetical protein